ncbi:hypothetical protein OIO90_002331 [Microbotryomycetes sp. JL221]|nr:hypothetical protein OIO90_002331 [Microbotryomycetes sp. JL221]
MSGKPPPKRPLNPPRPLSSDKVGPTERLSTPPPRTRSPASSNNGGSRSPSSRKPVPQVSDNDDTPSPTSTIVRPSQPAAPRPTNPNPFGVKPNMTQRSVSTGSMRTQQPQHHQTQDSIDDYAVLNFERRPSAVDPLASSTGPRQLVGSNANNHSKSQQPVLPSTTSVRASTQASAAAAAQQAAGHGRKHSHSRQPSISLTNPTTTTASYDSATSPVSPTSSSAAKILPLQPAPTRTRAPMEAFASVDMLQGQKAHQDRTRGTEVFDSNGQYQGRASLGEQPTFNMLRRQDPTENVRAARGGGGGSGHRQQTSAPAAPFAEVDAASIANQLREHDARRGSEDRRESIWQRSSLSGHSDDELSEPALDFTQVQDFSFPTRKPVPAYTTDEFGGGELTEKSLFADSISSKERLTIANGGGWRTEHLGNSEKAFNMQRPSIVALPVYPSPSGTIGRSLKLKLKRLSTKLSWFTVLLSQAATWVYLWKRFEAMSIVEDRLPNAFVGAWCFLALETLLAVIMTISSFWAVFTFRSSQDEPKMRLRGDSNLPAVDVFIVPSGQPDKTTFDCAVAASSMDYPPHRYRVMVLDPTGSAELQRDINKHAKSQACPHLSYHRRALNPDGSDVFYTKSNSVNFGMMEATSFGVKGPAEFIAVFDADMIPERNYLRAMLPSILGADKVGLVKTTHGFMNLPQRLDQSTSTLMTAAETPSDSRSGFLIRRHALTEIGGFPCDSWIQDGQCEALLKGRGYKVVTVNEVLQWTMARPTYGSQVNAMMINRLGPLRTAARLNFFLSGDKIKLMSTGARLHAIGRALSPLVSLLALLLATVYPFMFSYGGILVLTPDLVNLQAMLVFALIMVILNRVHEIVWCWSTGEASPRRALQAWIFGAPYQGVAVLRLILPVWIGGYARGSDLDINAASLNQRPPVLKRIGWMIVDPHTGMMVAFLSSVGVAVWRIVRDYERGTVDDHQTALTVLLTIAWPSLLWLDFVFAALVPFRCLLFPSRLLTEPRDSFLIRDHYTQVARPKHNYKTATPFKVNRFGEVIVGLVMLAWAVVAVALAFTTNIFV